MQAKASYYNLRAYWVEKLILNCDLDRTHSFSYRSCDKDIISKIARKRKNDKKWISQTLEDESERKIELLLCVDIEIHQEKSETAWRKNRAVFFRIPAREFSNLHQQNRRVYWFPIVSRSEKRRGCRMGRGRNKSVVHDGSPINWNPDALAVRSCLKYGKSNSRLNTTLRLMGIINYRDWYVDPLFIPPSAPPSPLCLQLV